MRTASLQGAAGLTVAAAIGLLLGDAADMALRFDVRIVERALLGDATAATAVSNGRTRRPIRAGGELLPIDPS